MTAATSVEVDAPEITTAQQRKRVGWSAFLGTTIEYYDFTLYGLFGPIVFAELFFPKSDPSTALIAILAIYAVGFFGRPFGGLVFSHYGDKIGRKPTMIVSMTLMGLASVAMGLLPGYATVGIWAPILLLILRVLQGFALGGESAGANVFSTEVSPAGKRGFFTSLVTSGIFVAWILAVSATTLVQYLGRDALLSWGWRLPFLASIVLVALGIWMRLNIEESAVFLKAVKKKQIARVPIAELLRVARKPAFIVLFAAMADVYVRLLLSRVRLQLRDSNAEDSAPHAAASASDREHNWTVSYTDVRCAVGPDRPPLGSGEWIHLCRCLHLDRLLSHALQLQHNAGLSRHDPADHHHLPDLAWRDRRVLFRAVPGCATAL